jgi:hypothetical protein
VTSQSCRFVLKGIKGSYKCSESISKPPHATQNQAFAQESDSRMALETRL